MCHVVNCHLLLNTSIALATSQWPFSSLADRVVRRDGLEKKNIPFCSMAEHITNTRVDIQEEATQWHRWRGKWRQTRSINNQQGDKLQCLNLNPGRRNGHDEEEWGKECKSRDCVCVCVTGGTLCLCVCVYFDDPQSKMHSGKEKRRRKLLPHKV